MQSIKNKGKFTFYRVNWKGELFCFAKNYLGKVVALQRKSINLIIKWLIYEIKINLNNYTCYK